ncbi:MAG: hypothetical protein ACJAWV_002169 [Flammeovirgaceae bacterium]|jgi:hypothetical protein
MIYRNLTHKIEILILCVILFSCQEKIKNSINNNVESDSIQILVLLSKIQTSNQDIFSMSQIDSLVTTLDSLFTNEVLVKYFHPNMSFCGGALYGYYVDTNLLIINANYGGAEGAYSRRKIYWNDNQIIRIDYQEHYIDLEEYEKDNTLKTNNTPIITYTDTAYQILLASEPQMKKLVGDSVVSEEWDFFLAKRLVDCGFRMKEELKTDKRLSK